MGVGAGKCFRKKEPAGKGSLAMAIYLALPAFARSPCEMKKVAYARGKAPKSAAKN